MTKSTTCFLHVTIKFVILLELVSSIAVVVDALATPPRTQPLLIPTPKDDSVFSSSPRKHQPMQSAAGKMLPTRRGILNNIVVAAAAVTTGAVFQSQSVYAFDNHVPDYAKYAEKNKRRGTPPKDLGMRERTTEGEDDTITELGLRSCDGNPNCFSTTGDFYLEDRQQYGSDYLIPKWIPPKDVDVKSSFGSLKQVVKEYEPGQGGVDGGGFGVIQETDSYIYVQFESLKKGFIDDVEFAIDPKGDGVLVRSASRLGFTDFGVNAVRLNYISSKLCDKGWTIPPITTKTHRDYWGSAEAARGDTFDEDRRRMVGAIE